MTYLLDADAVIDELTGQIWMRELRPTLAAGGMSVSILTEFELWEGVYGSRDPAESERALLIFLAGVTTLPVTRQVAQTTARLRAGLRARRRPVSQRALDLVIAGTALTHGLILVTSNMRHYEDIGGLKPLNPRTPA